jgi:hypothetical protein
MYRHTWIVSWLFIILYLFIACLSCPVFYFLPHSTLYMLHSFYVCLFPHPHILTLSLYVIYKTSECHGALRSYTLGIWGSFRWGITEVRKDLVLRLLQWRTVNTHKQVSCPLPSRLRNLPIPNLLGYVCMYGYLDGCLTSYPVRCTNRYIIRPFHSSKQQPPSPRIHLPFLSLSLLLCYGKNPKLGFPDVKILLAIDKGVVTLLQAWR